MLGNHNLHQNRSDDRGLRQTGLETGSQVDELRLKLDRLVLINMALWSFIQETTGKTEEDLIARVRELDLIDGQADGKIQTRVFKCQQCGRTLNKRQSKCLYCGSERQYTTIFEEVL